MSLSIPDAGAAPGALQAPKTALALFLFLALACAPSVVEKGSPASFNYASIAAKRIGYGAPIVVSSEIFYENRFTNQSYHSIDKSLTRDAFLRDFKQAVLAHDLDWHQLPPRVDSMFQVRYAYAATVPDTLPEDIVRSLRDDSVDVVVFTGDIRLYHRQMIGLRPGGEGTVKSYGSVFVKKFSFVCAVFDVSRNALLWRMPVHAEEDSGALGLFEAGVGRMFDALLRRAHRPD